MFQPQHGLAVGQWLFGWFVAIPLMRAILAMLTIHDFLKTAARDGWRYAFQTWGHG